MQVSISENDFNIVKLILGKIRRIGQKT